MTNSGKTRPKAFKLAGEHDDNHVIPPKLRYDVLRGLVLSRVLDKIEEMIVVHLRYPARLRKRLRSTNPLEHLAKMTTGDEAIKQLAAAS